MKALFTFLLALGLPILATAQPAPLHEGPAEDITAILAQGRALSEAYMAGDIEALVAVYAEDGIAAPGGRDFVRGHDALMDLWQISEGTVITYHHATPEELKVQGDFAYDWGYYGGMATYNGEERPAFRGKYLIVWQRDDDGMWRIAHDMWNSLPEED